MRWVLAPCCVMVTMSNAFTVMTCAQSPSTQPEAMLDELMIEERGSWRVQDEGQAKLQAIKESERAKVVRSKSREFAECVRKAMVLPIPTELDVPTGPEAKVGEGSQRYVEQTAKAKAASRMLSMLEKESAEPLLKDAFAARVKLAIDSRALSDRNLPAATDEARAHFRRASWYEARCADVIRAAMTLKSECLVDPLFKLLDAGDKPRSINQTAMAYLESFPQRRDEFIRRLKEVLSRGEVIGVDRRCEIEEALRRLDREKAKPAGS